MSSIAPPIELKQPTGGAFGDSAIELKQPTGGAFGDSAIELKQPTGGAFGDSGLAEATVRVQTRA